MHSVSEDVSKLALLLRVRVIEIDSRIGVTVRTLPTGFERTLYSFAI